jgi:hypothetical protein
VVDDGEPGPGADQLAEKKHASDATPGSAPRAMRGPPVRGEASFTTRT